MKKNYKFGLFALLVTTPLLVGSLIFASGTGKHVGTFKCVSTKNTYGSLKFPAELSSGLPCNVDMATVKGKSIPEKQRYFDIFSWQSFIALSWPTEKKGTKLKKKFIDPGKPRWNYWKESYEIFLNKGATPAAWGNKTIPEQVCKNIKDTGSMKILYRTNKTINNSPKKRVANELDQAFTYPLVDQNGNMVHYEVLLNYDQFHYIFQNGLYNIDGQIAYSEKGKSANFPKGHNASLTTGAIELKMAWKVLTPEDPHQRYYVEDALIAGPARNCKKAKVGLIGVHFSHKTEYNKQWIWATFEHVDNVRVNRLKQVKLQNGKTANLRPSFNNPDCPTCPVNVLNKDASGNYTPVQVTRVIPIDKNTEQLNRQVQHILKKNNSVFQYYELVGSQWPTDESIPPADPSQFSSDKNTAYEQIANKAGGKPHPVYLVNSIMETFMQYGNQKAQLQIQGFPFNETPVFGTESCIGCHYSAGIAVGYIHDGYGVKRAVYGPASSGDFSWLLQLKAKWKE